jgi:outer membrane protein OmpA-like peptidoglycan-associated protein
MNVSNAEKKYMKSRTLKSTCLVLTSTCLVFLSLGCKKIEPLKLDCNASAPSIYPGDAETVTGTPGSVATKKNWDVVYTWSGPGVTGNGTTATVATGSQDPGNYTVKGEAKEGKKGKEGMKPNTTASCEANYTVKPFEPPTLSCAASPTSVMSGGSSTITATGSSPQNRPLTYSFSSSAGSISGTGSSATLTTTGAPAGSITVTCSVQDDKAHSVSATTSVDVQVPPPPPAPKTQTLCSIQFDRDARRPTRVDNEAKACLDDVALNAQQKADATIVVVGNSAEPPAKKGHHHHGHELTAADLAAQRAVNTKDYLVTDKGIDASRIQVKTGTSGQNEVGDYLVPAGANFDNDVPGTTAVDESAVKAQPRNPVAHHHHKAKAAAKAASK